MIKIISNSLGLVATAIVIFIVYQKDIRKILIGEIGANFIVALSYLMLNGISGAGICVLATLHTVASYIISKKSKRFPWTLTVGFIVLYTLFTFITYRVPIDLIPYFCTVLFSLAIMQKRPSSYRIFKTANALVWIVYDISVIALSTTLTHAFLLISGIIAIIKMDILKK